MFARLIDWYRARRRCEVRIAPMDVKGRVYVNKKELSRNDGHNAVAAPIPKMKMRVVRISTGELENG